jgi:Flp pilus assembly protein TadG
MTPGMTTSRGGEARSRRRCSGDGGAVLVEFAIVAPLFFLLVFGIIEFGWAFYQNLDLRHGAREGSRLAAVNYKTTANPTPADQATEIVNELCDRMDSGGSVTVQISRSGTAAVGQPFTVSVHKPLQQLTGFFGFALNNVSLDSSVESRIEQTATWASMNSPQACP